MSEGKQKFLIGTYTETVIFGDGSRFNGNGQGIYLAEIDMTAGKMKQDQLIEGIKNPSYVCADKAGKRIYAVSWKSMKDLKAELSVFMKPGRTA